MYNLIKHYRIINNITQEELSRICNISLRNLQYIEHNKTIPSVLVAYKIKKALNVNYIEELFIFT